MSLPTIFNTELQREEFEHWKEEHPQGFFLNCRKGSKGRRATKQDKIHNLGHSRCSSLLGPRSWPSETWWKVCDQDSEALLNWLEKNGVQVSNRQMHLCHYCFPDGLDTFSELRI